MENKTKKTKVDYAAIIREYEMYARGRSLKQFCDDSDYVYPNVLRYYRKCFGIASRSWLLLQKATSLLFPWRLSQQQMMPPSLQQWKSANQMARRQHPLRVFRHTASSQCTYPLAMGWSCRSRSSLAFRFRTSACGRPSVLSSSAR